jgi:Leucine-rich repeat (LRR) protein
MEEDNIASSALLEAYRHMQTNSLYGEQYGLDNADIANLSMVSKTFRDESYKLPDVVEILNYKDTEHWQFLTSRSTNVVIFDEDETDLEFLSDMPRLCDLKIDRCVYEDISDALKNTGIRRLTVSRVRNLRQLSPIQNLRLTEIHINQMFQLESLPSWENNPIEIIKMDRVSRPRSIPTFRGLPLRSLTLHYMSSLAELPSLRGLPLQELDLDRLPSLRSIPELTGLPLTYLRVRDCERIEELPKLPETLKILKIATMPALRKIPDLSRLAPTMLCVTGVPNVTGGISSFDFKNLRNMDILIT